MGQLAGAEGGIQLGIERPGLLLVTGITLALAQGAAGETFLIGDLAHLAVLIAQAPAQALGQRAGQTHVVAQGKALALGGIHRRMSPGGGGQAFVAADAGADVILEQLIGQLQPITFAVIPAQFEQQVLPFLILRVGLFPGRANAAATAVGVGGLTIPAAQVQQRIQAAPASGQGGAALPAVVAAVVAGLQPQGLIIALVQIISRIWVSPRRGIWGLMWSASSAS